MVELKYSPCMGQFDGSTTCLGDRNSDDPDEREPCVDRMHCALFTEFLKAQKVPVELYLKKDEDGDLVPKHTPRKLHDFFEKLSMTRKRRAAISDKRKRGPKAKTRRAAAKALKKRAGDRRAILMEQIKTAAKRISERIGVEYAEDDGVVRPGQLFMIDRSVTSRYVVFKIRATKGRDYPISKVKLKADTMTFDVILPFTVAQLSELLPPTRYRRLKFKKHFDGSAFVAKVEKAEKIHLAYLVDAIVFLAKKGKIKTSG